MKMFVGQFSIALISFVAMVNIHVTNADRITGPDQIMGLAPEKRSLYAPIIGSNGEKLWKCLGDPSITLSYDQINDNYCDCPDGSDEIGTNACKFNESNMFYCANEGFFPNYIENFKLNDGACDYDTCCDGSDEYLTGACPNKCQEINNQFVAYKNNMNDMVQKSKKLTKLLVDAAGDATTKLKSQLDTLTLDIAKVENLISATEKKLMEAKNPQLVGQTAIINNLKSIGDRISSKLPQWKHHENHIKDRLIYLESLLEDLKNNPEKSTSQQVVQDYQFYLKTHATDLSEEASKDSSIHGDIEELLQVNKAATDTFSILDDGTIVPSISSMIHYYVKSLFEFFTSSKAIEIQQEAHNDNSENAKSQLIDSLELKLSTLQKDLKSKQARFDAIQKDLQEDYGPNGMLRSVKGKWINNKVGEYDYKVGLLGSIYQDDNLMGRYSHYKDGKLFYDKGHKCWNGPQRLTVLVLSCGLSNEVLSVSEPEKCEYLVEISSPLGCHELSEQELKETFKINYDDL